MGATSVTISVCRGERHMYSHVALHLLQSSDTDLRTTGFTYLDGESVKQRHLRAKLESDRFLKYHQDRGVLGMKHPRIPTAAAARLAQARTSAQLFLLGEGEEAIDIGVVEPQVRDERSRSADLGPDVHEQQLPVPSSIGGEISGRPSVLLPRRSHPSDF